MADKVGRVTAVWILLAMAAVAAVTDWVAVVGMGERFQIWGRDAWRERIREQRGVARNALLARARLRGGPMPAAANE